MPTSPQGRIARVMAVLAIISSSSAVPSIAADDNGKWYLAALSVQEVHQLARGDGVIVAVIDSGVDSDHPSLAGKVLPGADFTVSPSASAGPGNVDKDGHGTGMASLVVGTGEVQGIAPSAWILPIRVNVDEGVGSIGDSTATGAGIRWAVDHGANIISISLGSSVADPRERSAVDYAISRGVVVVASAGNTDHVSSVQFPARYKGVVAVCATNAQGAHSNISVIGPELTICAPGEKILHAGRDGGLVLGTGTSDAAAIVAGVVALILEKYPGLSPAGVTQRLTATAIDAGVSGQDAIYGFGIVDPLAAITMTLPANLPSRTQSSEIGRSPSASRPLPIVVASLVVVFGLLLTGGLVAVLLRRRSR